MAKAAAARKVAPHQPPAQARVIKHVGRPEPERDPLLPPIEIMPVGRYRVIHGSVCVPRPHAEWHRLDGTEIPEEPKFTYEYPGAEIELSSEEATRLYASNIIEELSAKPSKLGQVWVPPKQIRDLRPRP